MFKKCLRNAKIPNTIIKHNVGFYITYFLPTEGVLEAAGLAAGAVLGRLDALVGRFPGLEPAVFLGIPGMKVAVIDVQIMMNNLKKCNLKVNHLK